MSDRIAKEDYADAAVATHSADTTSVHGISDTSALETTTGSAAKVAAHEADTTAVHGITDTAALELGFIRTFASGRYYSAPGAGVGGTTTFTNQRQFFIPFHVPKSTAFDQIAVNVTVVGESGSKVRLGIYQDGGAGAPGALVVDAGQVAVDVGTGLKTISISQTLAGLYWLSSCVQAAASTQPTMTRFENSIQITMAWLIGATSGALGGVVLTKDSVSGAFADPAGAVSATGGVSVPSIWLRAT